MTSSPRIAILDIETAPILAYVWRIFDENIGLDQIKEDYSILSFAWKWLGESKTIYESTEGQRNVRKDKKLLTKLHKLLNEADIVIAQNGKNFDIKKINSRMIQHGIPPYSPVRIVDTYESCKRHFGFTSNKLAWTSAILTDTPKSIHKDFPGFLLWREIVEYGPRMKQAWAEMKLYNIRDVVATEAKYMKLRPWMNTHPNLGAYSDGPQHNCPNCGSENVQRRGVHVTQQGRRTRYQCQDCGTWSHDKKQVMSNSRRKALLK